MCWIEGAKTEAQQFVDGALVRREALFGGLELPRRLLQPTLQDVTAVRSSFVEGYGHLPKTLDGSLVHLIETAQRATRQIANPGCEFAGRDDN